MDISGILLLDKPPERTSHDMVNEVRRLFCTKRVGHTGTLDPIATGVLPICIGSATKAAELLTSDSKEYEAELILGAATDTGDRQGNIIRRCDKEIDFSLIEAVVSDFKGDMLQTPPMYSAKKQNGKKLYELARAGLTVDREPAHITIHDINVIGVKTDEHSIKIRVSCSKGTYIRVLCEDIGERLGTCAYMKELRRTASGRFLISQCRTLPQLHDLAEEERLSEAVIPPDELFDFECVYLPQRQAERLCSGVFVSHPNISDGVRYRTYSEDGEFLALTDCLDGRLHIYKSFRR